MLIPTQTVDRATNFIIEDESWSVVEYDHTSVPGIMYISLTEGKINEIYDDVENNIADTDKLAQYNLELPETAQIFQVGAPISPKFTLTKNGQPCDEPVVLLSTDKKIAKIVDGVLTAIAPGKTKIVARLVNFPSIQIEMEIEISDGAAQQFDAYISGDDKIRLDREATYTLIGTEEITKPVQYLIDYLDSGEIAKIIKTEGASCTVKANAKDKLGKIVLLAIYNSKIYTKNISIIPLW